MASLVDRLAAQLITGGGQALPQSCAAIARCTAIMP